MSVKRPPKAPPAVRCRKRWLSRHAWRTLFVARCSMWADHAATSKWHGDEHGTGSITLVTDRDRRRATEGSGHRLHTEREELIRALNVARENAKTATTRADEAEKLLYQVKSALGRHLTEPHDPSGYIGKEMR